jgi:ParB-like chromosome segregation protein Spo0J
MSLRINPLYEKLLPKMTEEDFTQLKESIQEEGQYYPIVANEDLEVLDGHHRFKACLELGIEPDFEVRQFEDKLVEKRFVIEANLRRRHLTNFQLVELAIPLLEIEKELAKKRKVEAGKIGRDIQLGLAPDGAAPKFKAKASEVIAKKVGLSTRTLDRGKKILEAASEEDKQKLRDGKASIAHVYNEVIAEEHGWQEPTTTKLSLEDLQAAKNRTLLIELLDKLEKHKLFCPSCKNNMFECTSCHKTLQESVMKKQDGT